MASSGYWNRVSEKPAPEGEVVDTFSPGGLQQTLKRQGNLWWTPSGDMYVYYTPEWWKPIEKDSDA